MELILPAFEDMGFVLRSADALAFMGSSMATSCTHRARVENTQGI